MAYINGTVVTDSQAQGKYETRLNHSYIKNESEGKVTITVKLEVRANNGNYSTESYNTPAYINGMEVHSGYFFFGGSTNWQVLGERTWDVWYDTDGKIRNYNLNGSFSTSAVGTYILKSGNISGNVDYPDIAREAYITSNIDLIVCGMDTVQNITFSNVGNYYKRLDYMIGDQVKFSKNIGQGTSSMVSFLQSEIEQLLLSETYKIRVKTYSDSNYTNQIGANKDKVGALTHEGVVWLGNRKAVPYIAVNNKYKLCIAYVGNRRTK